ncbi:WG repeat-containing protein [Algibacter sp. AS12]|uniref:WG repeat-containing protein n=1 Tax=Algibacter sp. AS12 TaxID=3135773 RepID=UPI00398AC4AD
MKKSKPHNMLIFNDANSKMIFFYVILFLLFPLISFAQLTAPINEDCTSLKERNESYGTGDNYNGWCDMQGKTAYVNCMCRNEMANERYTLRKEKLQSEIQKAQEKRNVYTNAKYEAREKGNDIWFAVQGDEKNLSTLKSTAISHYRDVITNITEEQIINQSIASYERTLYGESNIQESKLINEKNEYLDLIENIKGFSASKKIIIKTTNNQANSSSNSINNNSYVNNEKNIVEAALKGGAARYEREQKLARIEEARKAREAKPSDAYWFDSPAKRAALTSEQNAASEQQVTQAIGNLANSIDAAFRENAKKRGARKKAEREQRWKDEEEKSLADADLNYRQGLLSICGDFNNGIALVNPNLSHKFLYNSDNPSYDIKVLKSIGKYFYIDKQGRNVFNNEWEYGYPFYNGLACVRTNEGFTFIDSHGSEITAKRYDWVPHDFVGDYVKVLKNEKYGYIIRTGEEMIAPLFDELGEFNDGLAVAKKDDSSGYINISGQIVIPFDYWKALDFDGGRAIVFTNNKQLIIDTKGNIIKELAYDKVHEYSEGLARVTVRTSGTFYLDDRDVKYGYVDESGKLVIPIIYKYADDFSDGLARVTLDNKAGFINKEGETVIPFMYDSGYWFKNGIGIVIQKNENYDDYSERQTWGLINKKNEFIISFEENYNFLHLPTEGLIVAKKNKRYGFIDTSNNIKIPFKYYDAEPFENGMAKVKALIRCKSSPLSPDANSASVSGCEQGSEPYYINKSGRCVKDCNNIPNGFR